MTPQALQSLRNLGNECEAAADEIVQLQQDLAAARALVLSLLDGMIDAPRPSPLEWKLIGEQARARRAALAGKDAPKS
jgi:hypothetical protein